MKKPPDPHLQSFNRQPPTFNLLGNRANPSAFHQIAFLLTNIESLRYQPQLILNHLDLNPKSTPLNWVHDETPYTCRVRHALLSIPLSGRVDTLHRSPPLLFIFNQIEALLSKLPLFQVPNTSIKAHKLRSQMISEGTPKLSFWSQMGIKLPNLPESLCSGKNDDYSRPHSHQATLSSFNNTWVEPLVHGGVTAKSWAILLVVSGFMVSKPL